MLKDLWEHNNYARQMPVIVEKVEIWKRGRLFAITDWSAV